MGKHFYLRPKSSQEFEISSSVMIKEMIGKKLGSSKERAFKIVNLILFSNLN